MSATTHPELEGIGIGKYQYGWSDANDVGANSRRGLSEDVVRDISAKKSEPEWMLNLRLKGLTLFDKKPMPNWGSDLSGIKFDDIKYFVRSTEKQATSWEELYHSADVRLMPMEKAHLDKRNQIKERMKRSEFSENKK